MASTKRVSTILGNNTEVLYKNAAIIKVHKDDVYDIKFSTGKIETYIENISTLSFNSGDFVAVLISISPGMNPVIKIIGRGRRIETTDIPIVYV